MSHCIFNINNNEKKNLFQKSVITFFCDFLSLNFNHIILYGKLLGSTINIIKSVV